MPKREVSAELSRGMRNGIRIILGFLTAGVFAYLALRGVDREKILEAVSRVPFATILTCLGFWAVSNAVRIYRWQIMLHTFNKEVPWRYAAVPFLGGGALNNLLPLRAGDIIRAFGFSQSLNVTPSHVLATLILERCLDVLALLAYFLIGFSFLHTTGGIGPVADMARLALAMGILCVVGILLVPRAGAGLLLRVSRIPMVAYLSLLSRIARFFCKVLLSIAKISSLPTLLRLMAMSVFAWMFEGGIFYAAARGVAGARLDAGPWFAMSAANLSTVIPGAPGGIGTFDYFAKAGLAAYGYGAISAIVVALFVHALTWVATTVPGGVLILWVWTTKGIGGKLVAAIRPSPTLR